MLKTLNLAVVIARKLLIRCGDFIKIIQILDCRATKVTRGDEERHCSLPHDLG